jgi:SAM-dependent methyltransferase
MSTDDYVYDQGFAEERARLAGMEALWDPGSRALLSAYSGGTWLEVGGGGGALAEWMAERADSLLVTDVDTRFLEPLASATVEVRRHDIRTDPLPDAAFDVIHSRLVLEHLADRAAVLRKLVAALRPGGWIVIEDYDWTGFGFEPAAEASTRAAEAILGFMANAGFEPHYGRRVVADFVDAGLADVRGEGRALSIDSTSPGFAFFKLSFDSLRPAVVAAGLLSEADAEAAAAAISEPGGRVLTPLMMAAVGRKA